MNVEAGHILEAVNMRGPRIAEPQISGSDSTEYHKKLYKTGLSLPRPTWVAWVVYLCLS